MKHIYFNHWFTSFYRFLEMIEGYETFCSNKSEKSPIQNIADHFFVEPYHDNADFLSFYQDVCQKNEIEMFIPRRNLSLISKNRDTFDGTKIMLCADDSIMQLLDDKIKAFSHLSTIAPIPSYSIVSNVHSLREAYHSLLPKAPLCIKPVVGEGGIGFKQIKTRQLNLNSLYSMNGNSISFEELDFIFLKEENIPPFMMMEYLDGVEYSIDCLAYDGKLLTAVPRKKINSRICYLEDNKQLIDLAASITKYLNLSYAFNIQVKMKGKEYYLLEINPRMSGGTHASCKCGVNIPLLAIKLLEDPNYYDFHKKEFVPTLNRYVTKVGDEILLN